MNITRRQRCKILYVKYNTYYATIIDRDYPIIVVATSPKKTTIPSAVAMEMLHEIELTIPTETQRLAMLEGLSCDYLTSSGISWTYFARQTAVSYS